MRCFRWLLFIDFLGKAAECGLAHKITQKYSSQKVGQLPKKSGLGFSRAGFLCGLFRPSAYARLVVFDFLLQQKCMIVYHDGRQLAPLD